MISHQNFSVWSYGNPTYIMKLTVVSSQRPKTKGQRARLTGRMRRRQHGWRQRGPRNDGA